MKRVLKYYFSFIFLALICTSTLYSQPCKYGWNYRKKISFYNSGPILRNFQVEFKLPTASLVSNSKAQSDASDIRIVDSLGVDLDFWIDDDTYNTSSTSFWVKVDSLTAGGNTSIFLFYGKDWNGGSQNFKQ